MVKTQVKSKDSLQVSVDEISKNPKCQHGPTLCFIRGKEKFFACSAYRNRKDCNFYMTHWEWMKNKKKQPNLKTNKVDQIALYQRLIEVTKSTDIKCFCHVCSKLFLSSEEDHTDHQVTTNLTIDALQSPTKFLIPFKDNKKEAQYFFADSSTQCILNIIMNNKLKDVVCIGTPRIHEYIKQHQELKLKSLLLDIDRRLFNFNKPEEFCHYNLFNNYFFDDTAKNEVFIPFVKASRNKLCIVIDPPFGGRLEALKSTFDELTKECTSVHDEIKSLPTILILPYFMEPHVNNYLSFQMSDYQVLYENHNSFKSNDDGKTGSAVRIFTNISLDRIKLSESEGYKFCDKCQKWVGKWNRHCDNCNDCTSKNGTTYVHCEHCDRCVKSTWKHCFRCSRCSLENHKCGNVPFTQKCFNCNSSGHKKNDCKKLSKNKGKTLDGRLSKNYKTIKKNK